MECSGAKSRAPPAPRASPRCCLTFASPLPPCCLAVASLLSPRCLAVALPLPRLCIAFCLAAASPLPRLLPRCCLASALLLLCFCLALCSLCVLCVFSVFSLSLQWLCVCGCAEAISDPPPFGRGSTKSTISCALSFNVNECPKLYFLVSERRKH